MKATDLFVKPLKTYFVNATWDTEASVWVSESNIPGLVIEASDLAKFEDLMYELAPEMLSANTHLHDVTQIYYSFTCKI